VRVAVRRRRVGVPVPELGHRRAPRRLPSIEIRTKNQR
jgi:hypothetical protein